MQRCFSIIEVCSIVNISLDLLTYLVAVATICLSAMAIECVMFHVCVGWLPQCVWVHGVYLQRSRAVLELHAGAMSREGDLCAVVLYLSLFIFLSLPSTHTHTLSLPSSLSLPSLFESISLSLLSLLLSLSLSPPFLLSLTISPLMIKLIL